MVGVNDVDVVEVTEKGFVVDVNELTTFDVSAKNVMFGTEDCLCSHRRR